MIQPSFNFEQFEEAIVNPLEGLELDELEMAIASILLTATKDKPMTSDYIIRQIETDLDLKITLRKFHEVIRFLRKDVNLPILSRRAKPAGYWWCQSLDEMSEFAADFLSQAKDEFHTISQMVKKNYPKMAGQLKLELKP